MSIESDIVGEKSSFEMVLKCIKLHFQLQLVSQMIHMKIQV